MRTLHLRKGDTFARIMTFKVNNVATDMTDWTVEADLTSVYGGTPIDLMVTWTNRVTGQAKFVLASESTIGLCEGEHILQIRAITPAGESESCMPITVKVRA